MQMDQVVINHTLNLLDPSLKNVYDLLLIISTLFLVPLLPNIVNNIFSIFLFRLLFNFINGPLEFFEIVSSFVKHKVQVGHLELGENVLAFDSILLLLAASTFVQNEVNGSPQAAAYC